MDRDELYPRIRVPEGVLDIMCEGMSLVDRPFAWDLDVNIDKQFRAAFSNPTTSDAGDLWHRCGCVADLKDHVRCWTCVHDFVDGRPQQFVAIERNDRAGDERGVVVSTLESRSAQQRDGDANEGGGGSDGIGAVMPGIRAEGGASEFFSGVRHLSVQPFLDEDNEEEDAEGERGGCVVRSANFPDALDGDADGGSDEGKGDGEAGHGFGLAMAIRMILIGRFGRNAKAAPDDQGTQNIGCGLNAVGDQCVGIAENACHDFCGGEE